MKSKAKVSNVSFKFISGNKTWEDAVAMETLAGGKKKNRCHYDYTGGDFRVFVDVFYSPLTDAFSTLEEASVVHLLERLVGLSDEGGGPLDALLAAGYLLGQLPQPHSLGKREQTRR